MHLGRISYLIAAFPVFIPSCLSLQVNEQKPSQVLGLALKATYSVVPIDGGSGSSGSSAGSGSVPGSVTITVVETLPPKTSFQTIYVASPPTTVRVTETVVVTETIRIINVSPEGRTTTTAKAATSESDEFKTRATPVMTPQTSSPSIISSSSSSCTLTSLPALGSFDSSTRTAARTPSITSVSVPLGTSLSSSSSSTTPYNGSTWHTSYPAWNSTMRQKRWPRRRPLP
ncbi:hypothetical protein VTI74DRAFT_2554 [Chaetomium olivicolor]